MNFIIFFIYVPLVHSASHTLITTYTGVNGQTVAEIPEFSSVTVFDGQQIDYYDSEIKKLITKQDWMEEFPSTGTWKKYTEIRERFQQTSKINIHFLMKQLNHPHGVRYQRMYGCGWDYVTRHIHGFDEYSYDGQDFISLDLEELRYTASVPEAIPTVQKWNKDREQLVYLKQYYRDKCTDWIYFLTSRKVDFERRGPTKTYFKILVVDVIFVLIVILAVLIVLYIGTAFLVRKMKSGYQPVSLLESDIYINKGI